MGKREGRSFITDLIDEECKRDPVFRREYEAEKLADQLRKARARSRITVESVAAAMNTAQPSVTRLESKPEAVALGRFIEYAHALGYEVALKKSTRGPIAKSSATRSVPVRKRQKQSA